MAYELMTYEVILERMINRVADEYPNIDTREGSMLYNALASAAVELAIAYTELDNILVESFVSTASREYLIVACEQMGIDTSMFNATNSVHKGRFNAEVELESRWNCGLYNYQVTEELGEEDGYYTYKLLCETTGVAPNNIKGELTAITDIPRDLTVAELVECLIEGEDETEDDDIREYYHNYVNATISDGNIAQYGQWCEAFDGIGKYKIFPLANGANTVEVSILTAETNGVASEELIAEFQEYLDPYSEGMGNGVAPIGAFVTVTTATETSLDVSANVTLKKGYTEISTIDSVLEKYFQDIAYEKNTVAYMSLGAAILNADCVDFISDLKINGGTADIKLGDREIPVVGTATWTVV
jgi:uncharacterized phage protein gp47/JayE